MLLPPQYLRVMDRRSEIKVLYASNKCYYTAINAVEKNNNADQYEFPDLRIRDRQFGPRYESGRGAKAQQPDRHHRTGNRQIRPSPTPETEHSTKHLPDSQKHTRQQRKSDQRHQPQPQPTATRK